MSFPNLLPAAGKAVSFGLAALVVIIVALPLLGAGAGIVA